jgi:hypothetical protein
MTLKEFEKLLDNFRNANDLIIQIENCEADIEDLKRVVKEIKTNLESDSNYYKVGFREFQIEAHGGYKYSITAEDAILAFERRIERNLSLIEVLQAKFESL